MARQPNLKDMAASISIDIQIDDMLNGIIFETEQLGTDSVLAWAETALCPLNTYNRYAFTSCIRDTTHPLEKHIHDILRQSSPPPVCWVSYITCHMAHVQCQMTCVTEKRRKKWEELVGVCYQRCLPCILSSTCIFSLRRQPQFQR